MSLDYGLGTMTATTIIYLSRKKKKKLYGINYTFKLSKNFLTYSIMCSFTEVNIIIYVVLKLLHFQ